MKKLQRFGGGVLFGFFLVLAGMTGCYVESPPPPYGEAPPPGPVYSYYYYPDCQVYFDPGRRDYFWLDGGIWRSGPVLPGVFVLHPDLRVMVRLNTPEPFRRHAEIVARYPAPHGHAAASFHFQYYPNAQVYYHPDSHTYHWMEGGTWHSGARLPASIDIRHENHVSVDLDSRDPSRQHAEISRRYPGRGEGRSEERGRDHGDRGDQPR